MCEEERRITQITMNVLADADGSAHSQHIAALCDDNTVWVICYRLDTSARTVWTPKWEQVEPIPRPMPQDYEDC